MTPDADSRALWRKTLEECREQMDWLVSQPISRGIAGLSELDAKLWRVGREWLRVHHPQGAAQGRPPSLEGGPDVYLATRIASQGGHTALLGDFVRALASGAGKALAGPHLILTDQGCEPGSRPAPEITQRTGIPEANIILVRGETLDEKLDDLFTSLLALKPARLFLFHHPQDPLASAVAQPQVAFQHILVRHADAVPSFGVYLPEVQIIDLHPWASAITRRHEISSELLLLTCPDLGPRPVGFLEKPGLTTASCGSQGKFDREYLYGYPETLGVILQTTGGRHFHIGPLDARLLEEIAAELRRSGIPPDRFIHIPWVQSLCQALWDCQCDLYFSSFPIDGARVNAEVAASSTPHLRHGRMRAATKPLFSIRLEGSLAWHTWKDLVQILQRVADRTTLEELSKAIRHSYDRLHHPTVFRRTLESILAGKGGTSDPDAAERDLIADRSMFTALPGLLTDIRVSLRDQERAPHPDKAWREQAGRIRRLWRRIVGA